MLENEQKNLKLANNASVPSIPEEALRISEPVQKAADIADGRPSTVKAAKHGDNQVQDEGSAKLNETPCPSCGAKSLTIEYRLQARELGTWSLAGTQPKVATRSWPWLRCTNCGAEARAKA